MHGRGFCFPKTLGVGHADPGVFSFSGGEVLANEQVVITLDEVLATLKCSRSSLYAWIQEQGFPKPLKFGSSSRWLAAEVKAWIERRADDR